MSTEFPYGSWPSPISSELLTRASVRLGEPQLAGSSIYWLESRPREAGRSVLLRRHADGTSAEVLPATCNVRSRAHEYGGGSYLALDDDTVFFVQADDQRVYRTAAGQAPVALTPAGPYRYADFCFDAKRQRLLCVREDHSAPEREESNTIVAISLGEPAAVAVLVAGHDFFSNPRLSPDGGHLSWLCWDHPCMPWDNSQCWLAGVNAEGDLQPPTCIAGGAGESIFQPQWSPDGQLYLVSDRSNWWNIYRVKTFELQGIEPRGIATAGSGLESTGLENGGLSNTGLEPVLELDAEFATPQWVFGMSTYGFLSATEILTCFSQRGEWQLGKINLASHTLTRIESPFCDISQVQCQQGQGLFLAAGHTSFSALYLLNAATSYLQTARECLQPPAANQLLAIAQSSSSELSPDLLSNPEPMSFTSGSASLAHGFFYPPRNNNAHGPTAGRPPLIVLCHGGPTGATDTGLDLKIQYWTSRGFAVMDVNYRGSTGYGRQYRNQLNGAWGVHDVEDVCAAAVQLVDLDRVNPEQLIIKGSSAGGYTVLAALTFANTFTVGTSLYGIGNLETLARDTHKFEARYLDSLIGPYPARRDLYLQRSPLYHAQQLNCPVIFFQGLEDKVVPPDQAETMVKALEEKGLAVAYVPFPGEGHGFRGAASIQRCLEAEWSFYGQLFGFDIPGDIEPVAVKNRARI